MAVLRALVFCIALVSLQRVATQRDYVEDTNISDLEAFMKKHPQIFNAVLKEEISKQNNVDRYFDRSKSFFQVMRMIQKDYPREVQSVMDNLLEAVSRYPEVSINSLPEPRALECPSDVACPTETAKDLREVWRELSNSLHQDNDDCEPCQVTIGGLQQMACTMPWETMRDAIIVACEDLFNSIGVDPIICNGTVTLQGQHLYCIAHEASPFDMCESLNSCYPSQRPAALHGEAKSPRRMPWEVKDYLQPRLRKKLIKKRKRSPRVKDTFRIIQLSDIHVQPNYAIGSAAQCTAFVCCLERDIPRDGTQSARKWGEYSCNMPEQTLQAFLRKVNEFQPDMVVYTGDSPPHTWWDETLESQLDCSNIVVNNMRNIITEGTKVYPNIGNHEMYPTNLYSMRLEDTHTMNQMFTKMWHDLAGLDVTANATFADMSYYTVLHREGLRIMCINTLYDWYPANFYNTLNQNDQFNSDHKNFVVNTLSAARANGEKVIILGHHPIGGGSAVLRTTTWWEDVALEYSDVIVLHVSGHTHQDEQLLVIDHDTDEAKGINLVTAIASPLAAVNPSLRVFEVDDQTFELQNFQTYTFRIDMQNPDKEPEIELGYDAKEAYGLTDLSPSSWQDLVLRFLDDDALFQTWYGNRLANSQLTPCASGATLCNEECKKREICTIWFPRLDEADDCVERWGQEPTTTTGAPPPTDKTTPDGSGVSATVASLCSILLATTVVTVFSQH